MHTHKHPLGETGRWCVKQLKDQNCDFAYIPFFFFLKVKASAFTHKASKQHRIMWIQWTVWRGKKQKLYSETLLVCVKFLYMLCLYIEKKKNRDPGFHLICGFQQG